MKKTFIILFALFTSITFAQETKEVTLTVIGQGKTKDVAKYSALRNALEKAFGTFISSNTTIFKDELVKDEIVSVSSGNIQNFEILSETQMPDGTFTSIVKATVSVGKLISFCESKGITVEFKGGLFAANIKLKELNKKNEIQVFKDLNKIICSLLKNLYDYSVEVGEPSAYSGDLWKIPVTVNSYSNKNLKKINDLLYSTFQSISLNDDEIIDYDSKGISSYEIKFNGKNYFLRSPESYNIIFNIFNNTLDRDESSYKHYGYFENDNNIYNQMLKFKISNGIYTVKGVDILNEVLYRSMDNYAKAGSDKFNFNKVINKINMEKSNGLTTPFFFNNTSDAFHYSQVSKFSNYEQKKEVYLSEGAISYLIHGTIKFNYILKMSELEKITQFSVSAIN
jgi:hypothetical protein